MAALMAELSNNAIWAPMRKEWCKHQCPGDGDMARGRNEPLRRWKQKSKPEGNHGQARLKLGCCRSAAEEQAGETKGLNSEHPGVVYCGDMFEGAGRLCNVTLYVLPLFHMHVPLSVVLNPLSRLVKHDNLAFIRQTPSFPVAYSL